MGPTFPSLTYGSWSWLATSGCRISNFVSNGTQRLTLVQTSKPVFRAQPNDVDIQKWLFFKVQIDTNDVTGLGASWKFDCGSMIIQEQK